MWHMSVIHSNWFIRALSEKAFAKRDDQTAATARAAQGRGDRGTGKKQLRCVPAK